MDGGVRVPPGTPPRAAHGVPLLTADPDGSPLPTPPRVSHVYNNPEKDPSTPIQQDNTLRPSQAKSEFVTPGLTLGARTLRSSVSAAAGQRSVGGSLRKFRSTVRAGNAHIPARRVVRYEEEEDATVEDRKPDATSPFLAEQSKENEAPAMPPSRSAPPQNIQPIARMPSAVKESVRHPSASSLSESIGSPDLDDKNTDYLERMREEAIRQQRTSFVPPGRAGQKSSAKETMFRGCKFLKLRRAGEGGFSTVWQVRGPTAIPVSGAHEIRMEEVSETNQAYFAMKQVSLKRLEPESREELVQEAQLMEQLASRPGNERYILRYFGHRLNRDSLKILLELGEMDFSHLLKSQGPLTHTQICDYWREMLEAVHFIHEQGNLVHTDLKPANFLLVRDRLKLIDFGIAQKIPLGTIHISREAIVGTPNYMAPEAIKMAKAHGRHVYKAGKASDVWSLGCILYQMVYGRPPFDRLPPDRKLEAIIDPQHKIPFPPHRALDDPNSEAVDAELLATMQATLQYHTAERAQIPQLLHDPLISPCNETVTISRKTLRDLVMRLCAHTLQGELTEENAVARADVLFYNLQSP
ncbi:Mps1p [Malassezia vespertilionis]|uniref:Mps1p n=1 Tax=Malassezia vespertilionis TaxID=2020962 RepID=A0A2N1JER1_9BASI|nr:Mps1p [Malassezia vespertilionis]